MVIKMKINWKKLIIITLLTFFVGSFFNFFTMNNMETFKELSKPIDVPGILFPIVWTILYLLMSVSYYIISNSNDKQKDESKTIYIVQLIINSLWSLIFFGFEAYLLAFIWIIILLIAVIVMIVKFYKVNRLSAYLQIPYVLWIIFAGYLNLGIYILNQ